MSLNSLYIIKAKIGNLFFFNKTYNLCYGLFISDFINYVEIIAFKSPSFMKKVKYDKLVKELFEAVLSSDAEEDKYCEKLVANVNFGLLEKGQNKVQKPKMFNTLEEVRYHQETYGGKVSILKKFKEEVVEQQYDFDFGLDIEANTNPKWIEE